MAVDETQKQQIIARLKAAGVEYSDRGEEIRLINVTPDRARQLGAITYGTYSTGYAKHARIPLTAERGAEIRQRAKQYSPDNYAAYGAAQNIGKPGFNVMRSEGWRPVTPDPKVLAERSKDPEQAKLIQQALTKEVIKAERPQYTQQRTAGQILSQARSQGLSLEKARALALQDPQARKVEERLAKEKYVSITTFQREQQKETIQPEKQPQKDKKPMSGGDYRAREAVFPKPKGKIAKAISFLTEKSERAAQESTTQEGYKRFTEAGKAFIFSAAATVPKTAYAILNPIETARGYFSFGKKAVTKPFEVGAQFKETVVRNPAGVAGTVAGYAALGKITGKAEAAIKTKVKTAELKGAQAKISTARTIRRTTDKKTLDLSKVNYEIVSKRGKTLYKGEGRAVNLIIDKNEKVALGRGFVTYDKPKITAKEIQIKKRFDISSRTVKTPEGTQSIILSKQQPKGKAGVTLVRTTQTKEGITKSLGFEYKVTKKTPLAESPVKGAFIGRSREIVRKPIEGGTKSFIESAAIGVGKKGAERILKEYQKTPSSPAPPTPPAKPAIGALKLQQLTTQEAKAFSRIKPIVEPKQRLTPVYVAPKVKTSPAIVPVSKQVSRQRPTVVTTTVIKEETVRRPISFTDIAQETEPKQREKVLTKPKTVQGRKSIEKTKPASIVDIKTIQRPKQKQVQRQVQVQYPTEPAPPRLRQRTITRSPYLPQLLPITTKSRVIFPYEEKQGKRKIVRRPFKTPRQPKEYKPSVFSAVFQIKAYKKPSTLTGFGVRPIITGGKKRKSRKRKKILAV